MLRADEIPAELFQSLMRRCMRDERCKAIADTLIAVAIWEGCGTEPEGLDTDQAIVELAQLLIAEPESEGGM